MQEISPQHTKHRLLAAASALFAERGFHGTTARDIAARAGVNLAASNYHYGSKRDLYLAVLRAQFAEIRALLTRRGATRPAHELHQLSRGELAGLLQARAQAMLDILIGQPLSVHATLLQREMCDPSEALPMIVDEFIRPMLSEVEQIIAQLEPGLGSDDVQRCAFSTIGQVLFYRFTMPAMLHMMRRDTYPRGWARAVAAHVTQFSLGGLEQVGAGRTTAPRHGQRATQRGLRPPAGRRSLTPR